MLKHWAKLRRYTNLVMLQHVVKRRVCCVQCRVRLFCVSIYTPLYSLTLHYTQHTHRSTVSLCTAHNTHAALHSHSTLHITHTPLYILTLHCTQHTHRPTVSLCTAHNTHTALQSHSALHITHTPLYILTLRCT